MDGIAVFNGSLRCQLRISRLLEIIKVDRVFRKVSIAEYDRVSQILRNDVGHSKDSSTRFTQPVPVDSEENLVRRVIATIGQFRG